jgi:hypothetical protein
MSLLNDAKTIFQPNDKNMALPVDTMSLTTLRSVAKRGAVVPPFRIQYHLLELTQVCPEQMLEVLKETV